MNYCGVDKKKLCAIMKTEQMTTLRRGSPSDAIFQCPSPDDIAFLSISTLSFLFLYSKGALIRGAFTVSKVVSQSSSPAGDEVVKIIFVGGVYVDENTYQAASVRSARSGLQSFLPKPFGGSAI